MRFGRFWNPAGEKVYEDGGSFQMKNKGGEEV
jgi:hypothetical protein